MDCIIQYILLFVFHGKSTTFLKQLVKKIPEITEVEHKIREIIVSLFKSSLVFEFWIFPLNHQLIKTNWLILNKKTKQSTKADLQ
jgi:hypothetical protein